MPEKRVWLNPEIEEIALEAEDEVLATCYTSSRPTRSNSVNSCRTGRCATYP